MLLAKIKTKNDFSLVNVTVQTRGFGAPTLTFICWHILNTHCIVLKLLKGTADIYDI